MMNEQLREIGLMKEGQIYIFRFDAASQRALLGVLGRFAADPGLNFSWHDGVIRYKTSLHLGDGLLTSDMLAALLGANVSTIDRYLPGVMSVLWNDVSPDDAIGLCEAC